MAKRSKQPVLKYRELHTLLTRCGAREVRQRGSHVIWEYSGVFAVFTPHGGGEDVPRNEIRRARNAWKLRPEDGVSDDQFFNGDWGARKA